jgi:GTP pyrophosphokinase
MADGWGDEPRAIKATIESVTPEIASVSATPLPPADPIAQLFADLKSKILEARPKEDVTPLDRAFALASEYHKGQLRNSGEAYILHPLMVAHILADMRMDVVSVTTGLLHDVVEDTSVTVEEIRKSFGEEVARCVDGVTTLVCRDW